MNDLAELTTVERIIHIGLVLLALFQIWKIYKAKAVPNAELIGIGAWLIHNLVYGVYVFLAVDISQVSVIQFLASWTSALRIHTIIIAISYMVMFRQRNGI